MRHRNRTAVGDAAEKIKTANELPPVMPTAMPLPPAEIVPLLAMPPKKVETVIEPPPAVTPTSMPPPSSAVIVPALEMPAGECRTR